MVIGLESKVNIAHLNLTSFRLKCDPFQEELDKARFHCNGDDDFIVMDRPITFMNCIRQREAAPAELVDTY